MSLKAIIHIDDDLDDLSIFQEVIAEISPSYLLKSFSDPKEAVSFLEETILKPSIIFLDKLYKSLKILGKPVEYIRYPTSTCR